MPRLQGHLQLIRDFQPSKHFLLGHLQGIQDLQLPNHLNRLQLSTHFRSTIPGLDTTTRLTWDIIMLLITNFGDNVAPAALL